MLTYTHSAEGLKIASLSVLTVNAKNKPLKTRREKLRN